MPSGRCKGISPLPPRRFSQSEPLSRGFWSGICAFLQKYDFAPFWPVFFQKRACIPAGNVVCCIQQDLLDTTYRSCSGVPPFTPLAACAFTPAQSGFLCRSLAAFGRGRDAVFLLPFSSFTFLSFTLPSPSGQAKRRPILHRAAALFFVLFSDFISFWKVL